jgi:integrase
VQKLTACLQTSWTVVDADGLPIEPVERWLEHLRVTNAAPNTVRSYATALALWWLFLDVDGLDWRSVGLGDVGSFVSWMRYRDAERTPAEATLSARLAAVVAFYRFHEAFGGVAVAQHLQKVAGRWRGPGRGVLAHLESRRDGRVPIVRVRRRRQRPPVFRPEEVTAILDDCGRASTTTSCSLRDRLFFETLAETGMRLGECLALQHRDWHLGRGSTPFVEIVPRDDHPLGLRVKGGRQRRVYVSDRLERLYAEWVWTLCDAGADVHAASWCRRVGRNGDLDDWYVFVNLDGGERFAPLAPGSVYERVRAGKRRLGDAVPPGWTPHWFRHTHATSLLLAGAPPLYVSRRLGHADVTTTLDLYGWVTEDAELTALDWRRLASGWQENSDA